MQVKIRFCDIIPALSLGHYNFFLWWERTPKKALVAPTLLFRNILRISPNKNVELWIFNLALLHHIFQYTSLNTSLNTHEITGKRNSCSIKYLVRLQHPLLIGHAYIYFKIWQSSVFSCQTFFLLLQSYFVLIWFLLFTPWYPCESKIRWNESICVLWSQYDDKSFMADIYKL